MSLHDRLLYEATDRRHGKVLFDRMKGALAKAASQAGPQGRPWVEDVQKLLLRYERVMYGPHGKFPPGGK